MPLKELSHKRKSVADLIRFIGNTTEHFDQTKNIRTPNYSILLGAGASVTSGIRSGQEMIRVWKNEVYEERPDEKKDVTLENYFTPNNAPEWYEDSNSYSSLFENRYDLQRHRRIFVEHEVAGKTPSLGYAYLVKLMEYGFFNTVFTTNFDDLLNEAFYRFSKKRPIVCAHDSSIAGVTVTSTRPKIIKLHGDYLFDNIKTTLRETESLETNMRKKFQEFAKDFGLIVVGYAGNDRSIMDILSHLLQHEDYFKNGIYWCIRKGDGQICPELKKLLWKDRVFYVEIDGFDELFAELNHTLNEGRLPIDDVFLSRSHQENIIRDLTENEYFKRENTSRFLVEDCRKLRNHFEENFAQDYLQFMRSQYTEQSKHRKNKSAKRKHPFNDLTIDDKKELNALMFEAFGLGHKKEVLGKLQAKDVFSMKDCDLKIELLELEASLIKNMDDETVRKYHDELIRLSPENENYYDIAAIRSSEIQQKMEYLSKAVSKFENDSYILNQYAECLLDYCENYVSKGDSTYELEKIKTLLDGSLNLNPDIGNKAYVYMHRYNNLIYSGDSSKKKEANEKLCEDVFALSRHHPQTLHVLNAAHSSKINEHLLNEALEFNKKTDNDRLVENTYLEMLEWYSERDWFSKELKLFEEYEALYEPSDKYKLTKAKRLIAHDYLEDALIILEDIPNNYEVHLNMMIVLARLERYEDLDKYYESLDFKEEFEEMYLSLTNRYDELTAHYQKLMDGKKIMNKTDINGMAFALLKLKRYEQVESLLRKHYEANDAPAEIIVNYIYAKTKIDRNYKSKGKTKLSERILNHRFIDYSDMAELGASCLMDKETDVINYLAKVLKKEPDAKYLIKKWPIMEPYLENHKVAKLLASSPKQLSDEYPK